MGCACRCEGGVDVINIDFCFLIEIYEISVFYRIGIFVDREYYGSVGNIIYGFLVFFIWVICFKYFCVGFSIYDFSVRFKVFEFFFFVEFFFCFF